MGRRTLSDKEITKVFNREFQDEAVEMIVDEEGNIIPENMSDEEVAFFRTKTEEDGQLKLEVRKDGLKKGEPDAITAYEIDVKSGVNPDAIIGNIDKDSNTLIAYEVIDAGVPSIAESRDDIIAVKNASGVNNVVIKEYKIDRLDLFNPPMEDFHSMVRNKYKRKGKPEIGYLKYKHVLKESVSCLLDTYKNVSYLEDVSIKFRVYKDGKIEFLELFGVDNAQCIESVKASITDGPSWEIKDYYESIDIEVPFKVLYPFLF